MVAASASEWSYGFGFRVSVFGFVSVSTRNPKLETTKFRRMLMMRFPLPAAPGAWTIRL